MSAFKNDQFPNALSGLFESESATVSLNLGDECVEAWFPKLGNQVDFTKLRPYEPAFRSAVDIELFCQYPECGNWLTEVSGDQVGFGFKSGVKLLKETEGDAVGFKFTCNPSQGADEYIYFSGNILAPSGEEISFDFNETLIINTAEGSHFAFEINNFSDTISPEFFTGEYIPDGDCAGSPLTNPRIVSSLGTGITSTVITENLITFKSGTGSSDGTNIVFDESLLSGEGYEISFNAKAFGNFYDDDDTDGTFKFGFVFKDDPDSLRTVSSIWRYHDPLNPDSINFNHPILGVWLPSRPGTATGNVRWSKNPGYTNEAYPTLGKNPLSGNVLILGRVIPNGTNIDFELWFDDTLVYFKSVPIGNTGSIFPFFHIHNYNNNGYVEITNLKSQVCSSLIEFYPSSDHNLSVEFAENARLEVDIKAEPNFSNVGLYSGEYVTADLDTNPLFTPTFEFYDGSWAEANLSTSTIFSTEFSEGGYVIAALETSTPLLLNPNFYDGGSSQVDLRTVSVLAFEFGDGANLSFELASNPAANLIIDGYAGETASFISLSTAANLGSFAFTDGSTASVEGLSTLENWLVFDGASIGFRIATDDNLPLSGYDGEFTEVILSVRPSEGIGSFRGYDGQRLDPSFTTLPQVLIYPNLISAREEFTYDVLGLRGIDLLVETCCSVSDSHELIELTQGPEPYEYYHGDKHIFSVELSTLKRFDLKMYSGEEFASNDTNNSLISLNFFDGACSGVDHIELDFYNFDLCEGNFIPEGDNINVELVSLDTSCNETTLMFDGATTSVLLNNSVQFDLNMFTGEHLSFDLFIDPILRFNIYSGEFARISNPEFSMSFYDGSYHQVWFYESPYMAASGESVEVSLSTDYDVEFLEVGCLDNEYVPMNENGDPDWDKFNPVPVELEFFTHSIKARCF